MAKNENIIAKIKEQGLLPLFFLPDAEVSRSVVQSLYDAGIRVIEYTNRGENALENFKSLIKYRNKNWKDLILAVGTIKTAKDAKAYIKAGADFIISPGIVEEVAVRAKDAGLLYVPGCMTPTEIIFAESLGARLVKLFPGNLLGPSYVSSIKELFPNVEFMPTGGVEAEGNNLKGWFQAGVVAVGMGSKLISKPLVDNKDYERIKTLTVEAIELVRRVRQ
jgi:2-dehydro-3-deoxyphosphogluconate aldolase/(4S)-4-hydroxy-2-oxoglutarate aldolase